VLSIIPEQHTLFRTRLIYQYAFNKETRALATAAGFPFHMELY
jgi:hypothetical protein